MLALYFSESMIFREFSSAPLISLLKTKQWMAKKLTGLERLRKIPAMFPGLMMWKLFSKHPVSQSYLIRRLSSPQRMPINLLTAHSTQL